MIGTTGEEARNTRFGMNPRERENPPARVGNLMPRCNPNKAQDRKSAKRRRPMTRSEIPEAYALRRFHWQLFVTLTFRKPPPSKVHSISRVFAWLRETAALGHIHFRRLFWVLVFESGRKGSHRHCHLCLAGLPPASLTRQLYRVLESNWRTIAGGLSEVNLYDPTRDGVGYILKLPPESHMCHRCKGGVFRSDGEDCEPMLSASLIEGVRRGRM